MLVSFCQESIFKGVQNIAISKKNGLRPNNDEFI